MPEHAAAPHAGPPPRHHMALMIWVAVFPTLTVLELLFHRWLEHLPLVAQTLVLSALVVLTVVYVLMPRLQRVRVRLLARGSR
ncbi:hypothetical protein I5Q34_07835 [Streptomyces sp. AV19]|uniref:hypothetical protein n=1 Tax=Streptomyces sp. AV19 TaxID=2793068 RepID=UPI0018FE2C64|nr:hypothetical protein [Streptomyces sp. AV19]MBH1934208.1 hypothetical protein [Streptomyces sp. AV19]MDG4533872.1 hypothetical protein [Streptomyces sp. AV19]